MKSENADEFDDPSRSLAVRTAQLPQYRDSAAAMELFLDAIHEDGRSLQRATNVPGTVKWADGTEIAAENFSYFVARKKALEDEFLAELSDRIGAPKAKEFCVTIAGDWFSGTKGRRGPRVGGLKAAIRSYLVPLLRSAALESVVILAQQDLPAATFSAQDVARILQLNHELLYKHLEAWKDSHPNARRLSSDDIFLRRGLGLDKPFEDHDIYREMDFINSYSLAFSSPEKFAQMQKHKVPTIINGDLALFEERVLFFSPFIPDMEVGQLEFGVIPALKQLPLKDHGVHGGISEYQLAPRPFDDEHSTPPDWGDL